MLGHGSRGCIYWTFDARFIGKTFTCRSVTCRSGSPSVKRGKIVELALWVADCSNTDIQSVGMGFHRFLCSFGLTHCITFVHFGTGAMVVCTLPRAGVADGTLSLDVNSSGAGPAPSETRDTGQLGICRHHQMIIVLPGFEKVDGVQLVFKNSFIHAVAPLDLEAPLQAPTLQRLRTA